MSALKEKNIATYCLHGEQDNTPFPIVSLK